MILTTEERERLAVLCGFEVGENEMANTIGIGNVTDLTDQRTIWKREWKPDSLESPQWQLQAVLEAVEEAGMDFVYRFNNNLREIVDTSDLELTDDDIREDPNKAERNFALSSFRYFSAPPEQICRAILRCMEEEGE